MEFSFSPKLLVVAVAAALPLIASAADTPSTATARKGFAGYDHPNQYLVKPATTIADNMMPEIESIKDINEMASYDFKLPEGKIDIVISGLGFVSVNCPNANVRVHAPQGVGVFIREALI